MKHNRAASRPAAGPPLSHELDIKGILRCKSGGRAQPISSPSVRRSNRADSATARGLAAPELPEHRARPVGPETTSTTGGMRWRFKER
ncbi:hypothetical protein EVAR_13680_1 [Eumeta japonica]|uniref:Uncharacterized protein n=1 Tax=Eumeta variegata TaxID=151549 RepID=A0A4C1UBB5_EUMVA|nr:hypothetical protein EVAR_13680_1 [Eumeta japonica]